MPSFDSWPEMLNNLPKVTQLIRAELGLEPWAFGLFHPAEGVRAVIISSPLEGGSAKLNSQAGNQEPGRSEGKDHQLTNYSDHY